MQPHPPLPHELLGREAVLDRPLFGPREPTTRKTVGAREHMISTPTRSARGRNPNRRETLVACRCLHLAKPRCSTPPLPGRHLALNMQAAILHMCVKSMFHQEKKSQIKLSVLDQYYYICYTYIFRNTTVVQEEGEKGSPNDRVEPNSNNLGPTMKSIVVQYNMSR